MWCNVCKLPAHGDRTCYKLVFTLNETIEKRIEIIDHMIQEIITKSMMHCCSTCGCAYIKEEGCNLMCCPKCNSMTCYLCNMKLYYKNDNKYWHFKGHELADPGTTCQLWNNVAGDGKANQGNLEFNDKAIEKELLKFTFENDDNRDIKKLICKRIEKIFEKDAAHVGMIRMFKRMSI